MDPSDPAQPAPVAPAVPAVPAAAGERRSKRPESDESVHDLRKVFDATILAMASLAEPGETANHILRTQHFVRALAQRLRACPAYAGLMSDRYIETLFSAAPCHDIGNSGVPDRILLKPGRLTDEELAIVKTHPALGRNAIDQIEHSAGLSTEFLDIARDIAYSHQERWNGSGYPQGLAGEDIPLAARVMAIADAYDALTSHRVYREGVTHDQAVQQIIQQRGGHFAPDMVDALIESQHELLAIAQRYADSDDDFQKRIDYLAKAIAESP